VDLRVLPERLTVCRLPGEAPWPQPPPGAGFYSATRTALEMSIVCMPDAVPPGALIEGGWRALMVGGPLDFGLVGIIAELTALLARAEVSVFVLSTFDTDVILVREASLSGAVEVLESAGHRVAFA
jgi:hypothetical protein